jgi:hypothetical protein
MYDIVLKSHIILPNISKSDEKKEKKRRRG